MRQTRTSGLANSSGLSQSDFPSFWFMVYASSANLAPPCSILVRVLSRIRRTTDVAFEGAMKAAVVRAAASRSTKMSRGHALDLKADYSQDRLRVEALVASHVIPAKSFCCASYQVRRCRRCGRAVADRRPGWTRKPGPKRSSRVRVLPNRVSWPPIGKSGRGTVLFTTARSARSCANALI